ncbi:MAG: DUF1559 domain-containing protein, partial [Planctomycetia bacterium]|nr:DUF1559 domain-containing protein [Planctomycetia bacterium]
GSDTWGGIFFMLPYMEQSAAYDTILAGAVKYYETHPSTLYNADKISISPIFATLIINTLCCPSDAYAARVAQGGDTTGLSCGTSIMFSGAECTVGYHEIQNQSNVMGWYVVDAMRARTMFSMGYWQSISAVIDGTSNTLAASESLTVETEKCDFTTPYSNKIGGGIAAAGTSLRNSSSGGPALSATLKTSVCMNTRSSTEPKYYNIAGARSFRGRRFALGYASMVTVNTILPPNSPSCGTGDFKAWGIFSASSNHSGGVNGVMADGSVRFFSNTIDCGDLSVDHLFDYTGPSQFGVWGAIGSINGGETIAL